MQSLEASKLQPINKDKERMHEAHEKVHELTEAFSKETERKLSEKMEVIQENKNAQMMAKQERLKEHVCFFIHAVLASALYLPVDVASTAHGM